MAKLINLAIDIMIRINDQTIEHKKEQVDEKHILHYLNAFITSSHLKIAKMIVMTSQNFIFISQLFDIKNERM